MKTTSPISVRSAHAQQAANIRGNLTQLPRTNYLLALHVAARNAEATHADFVFHTQRIMRLILEESLGCMRHVDVVTTTPIGLEFAGKRRAQEEIFAVSVPRAGDAFEAELRVLSPSARLGKILIQRDPERRVPVLYWSKLPEGIAGKEVLLMDPMMATAGTAKMAIDILAGAGVNPADIILVNFLTCPEALEALFDACPEVRVVTSFIDEGLTEKAFMRPGIGDFGDRYFGTFR
ncbi:MAG: uracil phosphoribosyltransferase [Acidimicrobiales bacterium]